MCVCVCVCVCVHNDENGQASNLRVGKLCVMVNIRCWISPK